MYCPNCKKTFVCEDGLYGHIDVAISESSNSELEVVFDCGYCSEQYVVTIAQEDLVPPKRALTDHEQ